MKTKLIIAALASIVLLVSVLLHSCHMMAPNAEQSAVKAFLSNFNRLKIQGNADSLLTCFKGSKKSKKFVALVDLLIDKDIENRPMISFDIDGSDIHLVNADSYTVNIPAKFSYHKLSAKPSVLTLTLVKTGPNRFKIKQADVNQFFADYTQFKNGISEDTAAEKIVFDPLTLAAFKTAEALKTKYDSIIWFAYVGKKTYYYVVKGKWDMQKDIDKYLPRYKDSVIEPFKMGLVNPDLKEIIPPEYDLIHTINATFPGLVEVEKANKKGFYDLNGKIAVPVKYDQIIPIEDEINLAVLRNGDAYFYLTKGMNISAEASLKVSDFFSKIKNLKNNFNLYAKAMEVITEFNSEDISSAIYIAPSYLTDLNMVEKRQEFINPLRKQRYEFGHKNFEVSLSAKSGQADNWLEAFFYAISDEFVGGRGELYDRRNIVILDKKHDKVYAHELAVNFDPNDEGGSSLPATCDINSLKVINDSLFEIKTNAVLGINLYDTTKSISGGVYYHYLAIRNNKLVELPGGRNFGFTKYVKMDESYLDCCYEMITSNSSNTAVQTKTINHITPEILRYMKNEIFADYKYRFKDKRWQAIFMDPIATYFDKNRHEVKRKFNANVDDSLTAIDKYNINFIMQKLNEKKPNPSILTAK